MKRFLNMMVVTGVLAISVISCTKLDEELYGGKSIDDNTQASASDLGAVYSQLNGFSDQANLYALLEHPSDEMMGPTRGTDWDDFGVWRKLHQHTWDPLHNQIFTTWNQLNTGLFRATQVVTKGATEQIKAEARFLRAFYMFYLVDLFGQVPFRDPDADPDVNPQVFNRKAATDFIIQDLEAAIPNLPTGDKGRATKEAANFLLAKVYLNKAVYYQDPANPAGPFNFVKEDMDKVITYCNAVISANQFQLDDSYFDNFKWDNTTASSELIFVRENVEGQSQTATAENRSRMTMHYNTTPNGWNGFTTLVDFYNLFEEGDQRKGGSLPGYTDKTGSNVGFLIGQQYKRNAAGTLEAVKDRSGQPLIFTPDVNINYATEAQGIRAIKYPLNPDRWGQSGNDYVFFRYADLLLMKAEAILRGGTDPLGETPLAIVNNIRTKRGATALGNVDNATLLAERGRELYWEGWRRNDQIRFGTFNAPVQGRGTASAPTRVVFPIPQRAVDTNPNLKQNPGY